MLLVFQFGILICVERLRIFDISGIHHQQEFWFAFLGAVRTEILNPLIGGTKFKSEEAHSKQSDQLVLGISDKTVHFTGFSIVFSIKNCCMGEREMSWVAGSSTC